VDHTLTDQSSIIHFVEDNWLSGKRIGSGSFDADSGSVNNMFDFSREHEWDSHGNDGLFLLDPSTGEPQGFGHR
jgi:phospholipase C